MPTLLWRILGFTSVGIGIVNAFIPLMPTTVFLLVGAWALGKGSPEWRARLIAHPRFGRALRDWEDGRRVSRRGKRLAALGMAIGWIILVIWRGLTPWSIGTGVLLAGIAFGCGADQSHAKRQPSERNRYLHRVRVGSRCNIELPGRNASVQGPR